MTTEELIKLIDARLRSDGPDALLRDCRMRLLELHDATRWRPISEAPKDGTWFIGYTPVIYGDPEITAMKYSPADALGFINQSGDEECFPTHFMPLPEGPK